jgi:putative Holliday junction resolvase
MEQFPVIGAGFEKDSRYVGLDLGRARCGIAIADAGETIATPLTTVKTEPRSKLARRILEALGLRYIKALVAGLPLNQYGEEGLAAQWCRQLGQQLGAELGVDVHFVDERFSTREAYSEGKRAGVKAKRNRETVDSGAAAVILQAFLDKAALKG